MNPAMENALNIPKGMPIARYKSQKQVVVPAGENGNELPLIDKDKPLKERWLAKARVFNLSDEQDLADYEAVWQKVCDGDAKICEYKTEFEDAKFVAMLRWAEFEYKLPNT